jgi:hypothetical protein
MARVTVGPKAGGGWQLTDSSKVYGTQREAVVDARKQLTTSGGGELSIKGRDGPVREQNTIGRRDPRRSKG